MSLLAPFAPRIGGGGVLTARGPGPDGAVYWELVSYDPITELEGAPYGSLRWEHTRTDRAGCAVNIYLAPVAPALAGCTDRVKIRWGTA